MKRLALFLLGVLLIPTAVLAQSTVTVRKFEVWVIYREVVRTLPPGHFDFRPVPTIHQGKWLRAGEDQLCLTMPNAISLGKRLWEGMDPENASDEINDAWGHVRCRSYPGLELTPHKYAVRSADGRHKTQVVWWLTRDGRSYYTGIPVSSD